jgi:hypothetical protein
MNRLPSSLSARALLVVASIVFVAQVFAQTDPLPSWNEGSSKKRLLSSCASRQVSTGKTTVLPMTRKTTVLANGGLMQSSPGL